MDEIVVRAIAKWPNVPGAADPLAAGPFAEAARTAGLMRIEGWDQIVVRAIAKWPNAPGAADPLAAGPFAGSGANCRPDAD